MARNEAGISKQIVLAEAVTNAVGGRRIKVAVFTTFEFEPSFFELHVLPCLFADVAWSNMPNVKRAQVRDTLIGPIGLQHMAVFYDRRGLKPEGGSARLDYDRIALAPPRGVFHAKNMMFLVENRSEDEASDNATEDSLVLITTSANLTRHGWHENLEVAQVLEIKSGEASAVRDDMLGQGGLLWFLEHLSPDRAPQPAVQAIRQFLREHTQSPSRLKHGGRLRPRLYVGRQRFPGFLRDEGRIAPDEYCLEIVSPFFENTADARTLIALLEAVNPVETRIYLPRDDDGTAQCSEDFFQAVQRLEKGSNVHWACLPSDLTRWSGTGDKTKHRNIHAKVYRLFKRSRAKEDWRDVQVVGSVNLSAAAHTGSTTGNFETAILVDLECARRPDWWMTPLETLPAGFAPQASDEDAGTLACHELTLRFDWEKVRLDYFWKAESRRPQRASMLANGCSLFEFEKIVFDAWRTLDEPARQSIQDRLKTSSLVELLVEGELPQPLLVQEVNMDQKPPLLEQLTAAEILEYWSLLTQDQRNDFLERKLAALLEAGPTPVRGLVGRPDRRRQLPAGLLPVPARDL